jgi:hypothetical protein
MITNEHKKSQLESRTQNMSRHLLKLLLDIVRFWTNAKDTPILISCKPLILGFQN